MKSDAEMYKSLNALTGQYKNDLPLAFPGELLLFKHTLVSAIKGIDHGSV